MDFLVKDGIFFIKCVLVAFKNDDNNQKQINEEWKKIIQRAYQIEYKI